MLAQKDLLRQLRAKFRAIDEFVGERARRRWAGAEAHALGRGGVSWVALATGMSRITIASGLREVTEGTDIPNDRQRREGAGRKRLGEKDPTLLIDLQRLIDPLTRGDPMSPLRWTCKSISQLVKQLREQGHTVSPMTVDRRLHELGYSLQSQRKTREGGTHPDRNAQFEYINAGVERFHRKGRPAVSIDTKKKELVGRYKNVGREWQKKGEPDEVKVHDFIDKKLGKVNPYGVYDLGRNEAWVSVGTDHDTPQFAVEALRRWWRRMGKRVYPQTPELLVTADSGGSNGSRPRLWKTELQRFCDETGLKVTVAHFPPGTSKWNKIEHRLFCHITRHWRGRSLETVETIVSLIGSTTTKAGLKVRAAIDTNSYPTGITIAAKEMKSLNITRHAFQGDWNYTIAPRKRRMI